MIHGRSFSPITAPRILPVSVAALGQVVPVIFFLVAALVSLTAMTRMVEEQRTQIGMMKALGYSGFHIAMKYVSYALAATLTGSILGAVIGVLCSSTIRVIAVKLTNAATKKKITGTTCPSAAILSASCPYST